MLRWIHAVLFSMLAVLALTSANIPLTVFAFLGGALAIGVGFGTQVLLKNMISGIMLLVERPLKLGDRIEVGAVVGTVTHIGVRSSTVRTSDGIEILVPNATFIENNVTNWTYSSGKVRRSIGVSLPYGVSSERVSKMLLAVARDHAEVVADPPPRVLLEDFGEEKKRYQLQYWIDYGRGADGSQIASDLRLAIEKEALAEGLAVPFPEGLGYVKAEPAKGEEPAATS
jgi:small-conductance mechanosensitive channel